MPQQINQLVVYGTLKIGGRLAYPLDKYRKSSTPCSFHGDMYSIHDSFPGVQNIAISDRTVIGELHEFDESDMPTVLSITDRIEGYCEGAPKERNLYRRVQMLVKKDGKDVPAWVYVFNQKIGDSKIVEDGNWRV